MTNYADAGVSGFTGWVWKIDRANHHLSDLSDQVGAYLDDSKSFELHHRFDRAAGVFTIEAEKREPPVEPGTHCWRHGSKPRSTRYFIWALASFPAERHQVRTLNSPSAPVANDRKRGLSRARHARASRSVTFTGCCPKTLRSRVLYNHSNPWALFSRMRIVSPFLWRQVGQHPLAALAQMSNYDKHRVGFTLPPLITGFGQTHATRWDPPRDFRCH